MQQSGLGGGWLTTHIIGERLIVVGVIIICAIILDQLFGEARRYHPLVGFGNCANWSEKRFNTHTNAAVSFFSGLLLVVVLVLPWVVLTVIAVWIAGEYYFLIDVLILYWAIGFKSLSEHVRPIYSHLAQGNLCDARSALARIVSRDTRAMSDSQVTAASIETTLENGCDSLFGALFWYLLGGAPLVVLYRLINTLDAMWGYRTARFEWFGKPAAKLDDFVNYIPARLTAISYAICGNFQQAIKSWRMFAPALASPNAGPTMSAGAGSLNLKLGGNAYYHDQLARKPLFGGEHTPQSIDIIRALRLLNYSLALWVVVIIAIALMMSKLT